MPWYAWVLLALQSLSFTMFLSLRGKKKTEDNEGREDKIIQLYNQIEEMLDSFEEYVGEMHTQLEEKRTELLELNRQAQVIYLQALEGTKQAAAQPEDILSAAQAQTPAPGKAETRGESKKKKPDKPSRLTDRDKEALGRFATKPQKVRFLMSRGLSIDEVAKELNIGKGEVLLIADLDKT